MTDTSRRDELFLAALELPTSERDRFLEEECGSDLGLLEDVRSLLAADAGASEFLGETVAEAAQTLLESGPAVAQGRLIGPYRVESVLGTGGMGTVYLARRNDQVFEKRVAIKVIRISADGEEMRRRFRTERQILANLEHPYIARLLDGGTTEDGSPYVVMEHVEGEAIDEWCDRTRASVPERLALFLRICEAVQDAHANLVVHRDIKPDNVLITADGSPRLIDFGIAKLIEPEPLLTGESASRTGTGMRMLTPEYASPEQLRGAPVTVATDVYSLGVLLYELLTGRWPFPGTTDDIRARERAVLEMTPEPPSVAVVRSDDRSSELAELRAATPEGLRRKLRGDLDTIVLAALRKEPRRRYGSVEQFADDVVRYLERRPIEARPDSLSYRATRFAQRNWIGLAAASIVTLSLVGGTLAAWNGMVRANTAQREAEANAARADTINAFLTGMLSAVQPDQAQGREITVREVLDSAVVRLESGGSDYEESEVGAALRFTIGESYLALGEMEPSRRMFERALAVQESLYGPYDDRILESYIRLGEISFVSGDAASALSNAQRILEIRRETLGTQHEEYSSALLNVANSYADLGQLDLAEPLAREAIEVDRAVLQGVDIRWLSYTLNSLGTILVDRGQYDEAVSVHEEALDLRSRFFGDTSTTVVTSMTNLSLAFLGAGRLAEAEETARGALVRAEAILDADHPRRGHAQLNVARALQAQGRDAEAEPLLRGALRTYENQLGADSWRAGMTRGFLAVSLLRLGRAGEADAELQRGWPSLAEALPAGHPRVAELAGEIADVYAALGSATAAEEWRTRAR